MIVTEIELVNFKNIKNFKQEFNGGVYLITGENDVGKTTLLSAITMLLTGDRGSNLLKQGEEKGHAKMKIGEYEIAIKFTEKSPRGYLSITAENGMTSENKSMLAQIFNYSDFDAHDFVSWSNTAEGRRKQVELVKSLLPEEIQKKIIQVDENTKQLKDERVQWNVKHTASKSIVSGFNISDEDVKKYSEEKDIRDLFEKKNQAVNHNNKIIEVEQRKKQRKIEISDFSITTKRVMFDHDNTIESLEASLKNAIEIQKEYQVKREKDLEELNNKQKLATKYLEENNPVDIGDLEEEISEADFHNGKVTEITAYNNAVSSFEKVDKKKSKFDKEIDSLIEQKEQLMIDAKLPIKGLTFTDDGLLLNGIPFAPGEVSTSQTMEVCAKLMIAKNPEVKVFRISQGESLGKDKMKAIIDFAKKNKYQGFIENVVRGQKEMRVENYTESEK